MTVLSKGAEATIFLKENKVIKERLSKTYRLKEIDEKLRKSRTKREAKVMKTLNELKISSPKIFTFCDKKMIIEMEYIEGMPLRETLNADYASQAGKIVGLMHENDIIHDDLTTANFVVKNGGVFVIDFGLSFFSKRIEDKAVDLHLFERSLNAHHTSIKDECWKSFLESYKIYKESDLVINHLKKVERRGRNK